MRGKETTTARCYFFAFYERPAMQFADGLRYHFRLVAALRSLPAVSGCGGSPIRSSRKGLAPSQLAVCAPRHTRTARPPPVAHPPRTPRSGAPGLGSGLLEAFLLSFGPRRPSFPRPCRALSWSIREPRQKRSTDGKQNRTKCAEMNNDAPAKKKRRKKA